MPLEFVGSYTNKFSSGGKIHEDNGGLPIPSSYQVNSHTSRGALSWHKMSTGHTAALLPLKCLLYGQLYGL